MIRDSGALICLHPFSNFKYVRSSCYLIERGHSNVPTLVGHFCEVELAMRDERNVRLRCQSERS